MLSNRIELRVVPLRSGPSKAATAGAASTDRGVRPGRGASGSTCRIDELVTDSRELLAKRIESPDLVRVEVLKRRIWFQTQLAY